MAVPQVIAINLDEQHADELKAELDDYLQQEAPHNPFININRGSCYNQKAADLISKTISKAELIWEDFLSALNLAYNTSYQSSIASSPFQLLHGYTPKLISKPQLQHLLKKDSSLSNECFKKLKTKFQRTRIPKQKDSLNHFLSQSSIGWPARQRRCPPGPWTRCALPPRN